MACGPCSLSRSPASTAATSWRKGILALTFADDADYERAKVGETWTLPHVKRELEEGAEEITVRIEESEDEFSVTHDLAAREREILVSGGLLHYLSEQTAA